MISFGPFLTRKGEPRWFEAEVFFTGFALEFTSEKCSADVPLFMGQKTDCVRFNDFVVQATDVMCVAGLMYEQLQEPALGTYVPLEALLVGLYQEHRPAIPLADFLIEFGKHVPFSFEERQLLALISAASAKPNKR